MGDLLEDRDVLGGRKDPPEFVGEFHTFVEDSVEVEEFRRGVGFGDLEEKREDFLGVLETFPGLDLELGQRLNEGWGGGRGFTSERVDELGEAFEQEERRLLLRDEVGG